MRTLVLITIAAATIAQAQDKPVIKMVPPSSTSAVSGTEMFATYCAVCHGKSGKGDGPAAASLKSAPPDLTQLTRKNGGKFPDIKVSQTITRDVEGAHGSREMPIWGTVFKSIESGDSVWRLRVQNLTEYIRSMQAK